MFSEKRDHTTRDVCHIRAAIQIGEETIDCIVEDISERGAKLRLSSPRPLPSSFSLQLPLLHEIIDQRVVALRWMLGTAVGVHFEPDTEPKVLRARTL